MWGWQTLTPVPALGGTTRRAPISIAESWNIQIIWNVTSQKAGSPMHGNEEQPFLFHPNRRTFNSEIAQIGWSVCDSSAWSPYNLKPLLYQWWTHPTTLSQSPCKTTTKSHIHVWGCGNSWSNKASGKTAYGRNNCFSFARHYSR